jgi:hypothetical protein
MGTRAAWTTATGRSLVEATRTKAATVERIIKVLERLLFSLSTQAPATPIIAKGKFVRKAGTSGSRSKSPRSKISTNTAFS